MRAIQKRIRINEEIRVREVRLIGAGGEQLGVLPLIEAQKKAREQNLDLVEVASQAQPPVCRIIDFSKYRYEQQKREREAKKKSHVVHVKEIKVKPFIEAHDYQVKLYHLQRFLAHGDKAKVTMFFRGREIAHADIGRRVIDRFISDLAKLAVIEKPPIMEGKSIVMVVAPK